MLLRPELLESLSPAIAAVAVYVCAARLVRSTAVFYVFGALLGVLASLIVIALAWQRFIPKVIPRDFTLTLACVSIML